MVFVDAQLRIRRYTPLATQLIRLLPTDVGRPLDHIATAFTGLDLPAGVRRVIEELGPQRAEVQHQDGRWFTLLISPYRTHDRQVAGAVIGFSDVTRLKTAGLQVTQALAYARTVLDTLPDPVVVIDHHFNVVSVNRTLLEVLGIALEDAEGVLFYDLGGGIFNLPYLLAALRETSNGGEPVRAFVADVQVPAAGERKFKFYGDRLVGVDSARELLLVMMEDVTELVIRSVAEGPGVSDESPPE